MLGLAGWLNRQQQEVVEYLRTENRILREKLGHKRLILRESQKRRLAGAAGVWTSFPPSQGPHLTYRMEHIGARDEVKSTTVVLERNNLTAIQ